MKRIASGAAALVIALLLCACGWKEYEYMAIASSGEAIARGKTLYSFYGFASNGDLVGEQIGILDGDRDHKVYVVKGYSDEDWLMSELDILMESGSYSLYRAEHVDSVPEELVIYTTPDLYFSENSR